MIIDLLSLPTYPQIYEKKSELLYYNDENLMFASLASNRRQTAFRLRADLLACPPTLDFLKGLAGRLRDEFPHDEKIWNAHQGKEEEGAGRGERRHIGKKPWSELTDKVGADPEGKSGNGHRDAADIVRIHLREEDENDGTDGNRALGLAADFGTDVPASEAVVLLAIHLPHLVNDMYRISLFCLGKMFWLKDAGREDYFNSVISATLDQ